jgi:hypothetical protein
MPDREISMKQAGLLFAVLCLLVAACGGTTTTTGTEGTATTTTVGETTTTTAAEPTSSAAATTTTLPGSFAVDHESYCVRGTAPTDILNVRTGPGGEYEDIGDLAYNATGVPATGIAAADSNGNAWFQIEYEGGTGWSAGWYLIPAPCDAAVASPAPIGGANYPYALSGGLVPWEYVNNQWILALYSGDAAGQTVLYLISPYGDTYEVYSWPTDEWPYIINDWKPDGRSVLVTLTDSTTWDREIRLLDLPSRTSALVEPIASTAPMANASFTRPTGRDLVVSISDTSTERVECRYTDGSLFSVFVDRPRSLDTREWTSWLYGLDGLNVVTGDGDGLHFLDNHGNLIRELADVGEYCIPVRWWDTSTVVAACVPSDVLAANPNSYYHRLWRVPIDGSAATAITAAPAVTPDIVDFGYKDAFRIGGSTYVQWWGDCGTASIGQVDAGGNVTTITGAVHGEEMIGVRGGNFVVWRWVDCGQDEGSLHLMATDGSTVADLIVPPAGAPGILDAHMVRDIS